MDAKITGLRHEQDVYFYEMERFNDVNCSYLDLRVSIIDSYLKIQDEEIEKVLLRISTNHDDKIDNGEISIELTKEQALFLSKNIKAIAKALKYT